jgi:hypothetical protein
MGSKARFVGTTWFGDTGLDYHKAVFHAFQTGDLLATNLAFTDGSDVTIAAHSLGNMVVSHAIQDGGFVPARYYLLNAAVATEAYDFANIDAAQTLAMTEDAWKNHEPRLFSANWHELFTNTPDDNRNRLSWKDRFKGIMDSGIAHNFYSPGEDVVENPTSSSSNILLDMFLKWDVSRGAWGHQEFVKGNMGLAGLFFSRTQAGWLRDAWYGSAPTSGITEEEMRTRPYFDEFLESDLMHTNATIASAKAAESKVQYDLFGRAIPVMSYAAAANAITSLDQFQPSHNFDMEAEGRTQGQWPIEGHAESRAGRWLHSDFKNVPLPYVHQMFEAMITIGSLR